MAATTEPRARYRGRRVEVRVGHGWQTVGYLDPPDAPDAVAAILAAISGAVFADRLARCHAAAEIDALTRRIGNATATDTDPTPAHGIARPDIAEWIAAQRRHAEHEAAANNDPWWEGYDAGLEDVAAELRTPAMQTATPTKG